MKKLYKRIYKSLNEGEGHITMIVALFALAFFILTILGVIPVAHISETLGAIESLRTPIAADTLITEKSFSLDIKNKLNKFKPEQVIEFKLPPLYSKEGSVVFEPVGAGVKNGKLQYFFDFKSMPVDEFVNLIEKFNCKLISYSYRKNVGLFRIGRLKGEK